MSRRIWIPAAAVGSMFIPGVGPAVATTLGKLGGLSTRAGTAIGGIATGGAGLISAGIGARAMGRAAELEHEAITRGQDIEEQALKRAGR